MDNKWKPTVPPPSTSDTRGVEHLPAQNHDSNTVKYTARKQRKGYFRPTGKAFTRFLYVLLVLIALIWLGIGVNAHWASSTATLKSHNSGRMETIVGEVRNLKAPLAIEYGQTSTSLPALKTAYENRITSINFLRPDKAWVGNSYPDQISQLNTVTDDANKVLDAMVLTLQTSRDALDVTARFLEYDPKTDLQLYVIGKEGNSTERLVRTEEGLKDVLAAIESSNVPYKRLLAQQVRQLLGRAESLKPADVPIWIGDVTKAQGNILQIIETNTTDALNTNAKNLETISTQYKERY